MKFLCYFSGMKTQPVTHNRVFSPKTTGYAAAIGLGLSVLSGISKDKKIRKMHKPFAYITAAFTALHICMIEYLKGKYKKM